MMRRIGAGILLVGFLSALAEPPAEVVRLNNVGIELLTKRRARDAVGAFEQAHDALPENQVLKRNLAAGLAALAETRRKAGASPEAVTLLDRAIVLHPQRLRYRVLRGRAQYEAGEGPQRFFARKDFAYVLRRDPDNLDALVNLGHILYLERELQRAVELWKRAATLSPDDADIKKRLAKAERELGVERSYKELRTPHFLVRYGTSVPDPLADTVLSLCSEAWEVLCRRFQYWPEGTTVVTLYSPSEFQSATQVHGWVAGLSDGTIRLTVRATDGARHLRPTLLHEFTHHLVRKIARKTPEWLHEGLAQMAEPRSREAAEARLRRQPPSAGALGETILGQRDPRRVSQLYDTALSFVHYLHDLSGDRGVHQLLRLLTQGKSQDEALSGVYGSGRDELFATWQRQRLQGR